jgi:mannose-6-phosphate isomerase
MTLPPAPLTFTPILKQIIWGGQRLGQRLGKPLGDAKDYAESWELVDRPADQSVVARGPHAGKTLAQLITTYKKEIFGRHATLQAFPLLLKYLDCNRVLSVQVHPDDRYAKKMTVPDLGKTEAWYIVEAMPDSVIYAGLREGVDRNDLEEAVRTGRTAETLHSFHPVAGQCVFIPAGTVHALGDGLLVAEVQQSSDTTFRLFDWDRTDAHGKPRALHIEQALEVTDYARGPVIPQVAVPDASGWDGLVDCDKFLLRQANSKSVSSSLQKLTTGGDEGLVVLMVTQGQVEIEGHDWEPVSLRSGETVLLPANAGEATVSLRSPDANVLEIQLPSF